MRWILLLLVSVIVVVTAKPTAVYQVTDGVGMNCYHTADPACQRKVFTIHAPHSGTFEILLHHAAASSSPFRATTNGAWHTDFTLPAATSEPFSMFVDLNKGLNILDLSSNDFALNFFEVVGGSTKRVQGATLPYVEVEAENAATNGAVIGPDYSFTHLPSEASGRKAVQLVDASHYIEFTFPTNANAVSIRYSIPDGGGVNTQLSVFLNGNHYKDITITSKYSWYYGSYPFTKNPGDGKPHHFYDEVSFWLDQTYPSGTKLKLQAPSSGFLFDFAFDDCNANDNQKRDCGFFGINETQCEQKNCCWKPNPPPNPGHIPDCFFPVGPPTPSPSPSPTPSPPPGTVPITIDLADFYLVGAAGSQPPNSLNIVDAGADPSGQQDSTNAIMTTINKATNSNQTVWIPTGTFTVTQHLGVNKVTIVGAGPWYSILHGNGVGIFGNSAGSYNVQVHNIAVIGEVMIRNDGDPANGVGGALNDCVFANIWISHQKCGFWLDGPFDNLLISGAFIHDTTADGINFHRGITNSVVEQTIVRNSGDDGLAMWSESTPDAKNQFRYNTIMTPVLANNIAIYGGSDNSILNNEVYDTITQGGGIHVGNRFGAVPLGGTTTISNNLVVRSGCLDPNWNFGVGAMWFYALDGAMNGNIVVTNNAIQDSPYEALHFIGSSVNNVQFNQLRISNVGTFVWQFQAGGTATVSGVVATGVGYFGQYNCGEPFKLTDQGGNSGWNSTHCGWPPAPAKFSDLIN